MDLGRAGSAGSAYGAHVEVVGATWYLFNRFTTDQPCPGQGADVRQMGTQVRASNDRGVSWGAPVPILAPTPGTPWSCAATDGDAVYDAGSGTWRYVFQCLGDGGRWQGCYAERRGRSPLGPFSAAAPVPNPVITPASSGIASAGIPATSAPAPGASSGHRRGHVQRVQ